MKGFAGIIVMGWMLISPVMADVKVEDPWVRAMVTQQKVTGGGMKIQSTENARLVGVKSPVAGATEIHEMSMKNNIMSMHSVESVDLPAGKTVAFKPGTYHLMLFDLKHALKVGEQVPLSLTVEYSDKRREEITVNAQVRPLGTQEE